MSARQSDLWGWRPEYDAGGAAIVARRPEVPRLSVAPLVSAAATWRQQFGDGTNDVFYLLATAGADDDVTASERLIAGGPDVALIVPGETVVLEADSALTRIDVVAIGDTKSGTPTTGEIVTIGDAAADVLAVMLTATFSSADDVRAVALACSERYSATTGGSPVATANYVDLYMRGLGYA